MLAETRYEIILQELNLQKRLTVKELSQHLQVSQDTVRRDLDVLAMRGNLTRVHGGAILPDRGSHKATSVAYMHRSELRKPQKISLAKEALNEVKEYQALAINAGTTNIEFAKLLVNQFHILTVFTNSLIIANVLDASPTFTVVLTGGFLDHAEHSFYGKGFGPQLSQFNFDTAFISINAISLEKGLTDFRKGEKETINSFCQGSEKTVVLADSSKFETVSYMKVCPLEFVDLFITDEELDPKLEQMYIEAGLCVKKANS